MRLNMTISVTVKCNHNFPVGWSFIIRKFQPRRECYPNVGCYKANSLLNTATSLLPMSPDKIRPTFNLYTRQNKATAQLLNPYDSNFKNSKLSKKSSTSNYLQTVKYM